jgi:DNA sulfur modification protein DndB
LLEPFVELDGKGQSELALRYWEHVSLHMREWNLVRDRRMTAGDVRADFIHSHGIVLSALGNAGARLLLDHPIGWEARLAGLAAIDWSRSNSSLWEGRALVGGHVSKSRQNVVLTTNVIKRALGLALNPDEQHHEDALKRGHNV